MICFIELYGKGYYLFSICINAALFWFVTKQIDIQQDDCH